MRMMSRRSPWRPVASFVQVDRPDALQKEAPAKGSGVERARAGELTPGLPLGFEEGVACGHRGGEVVVVLAREADEVEEVALATRHFVLPGTPFGA